MLLSIPLVHFLLSSLLGRVQQTLIRVKSSGFQPPDLQQNKVPGEAGLRSGLLFYFPLSSGTSNFLQPGDHLRPNKKSLEL